MHLAQTTISFLFLAALASLLILMLILHLVAKDTRGYPVARTVWFLALCLGGPMAALAWILVKSTTTRYGHFGPFYDPNGIDNDPEGSAILTMYEPRRDDAPAEMTKGDDHA